MENKLAPVATPEKLGLFVAKSLHWSGDLIMAAFIEALTDANFHSLASEIESIAIREGLFNEA